MEELWRCNHAVPASVEQCVYELMKIAAAQNNLTSTAICAWDREMTYGELDELSTRLAGHLVDLEVEPESVVPLCFEKSMWTVMAVLAVLKAGGGFLLLDSSSPRERLRLLSCKVSSTLALASAAGALAVQGLVATVVVVNRDLLLQIP